MPHLTCTVTVMKVNENNMLGDYLRARRELIQPGRAGLPVGRVRGLPWSRSCG